MKTSKIFVLFPLFLIEPGKRVIGCAKTVTNANPTTGAPTTTTATPTTTIPDCQTCTAAQLPVVMGTGPTGAPSLTPTITVSQANGCNVATVSCMKLGAGNGAQLAYNCFNSANCNGFICTLSAATDNPCVDMLVCNALGVWTLTQGPYPAGPQPAVTNLPVVNTYCYQF